jgi:hypothetical protein
LERVNPHWTVGIVARCEENLGRILRSHRRVLPGDGYAPIVEEARGYRDIAFYKARFLSPIDSD